MKIRALLCSLLLGSTLFGQDSLQTWRLHSLSLESSLGLESRAWSTRQLLQLSNPNQFLDAEAKDRLLASVAGGLGLGFRQSWGLAMQMERPGRSSLELAVSQQALLGLNASHDALALALRGNKASAGDRQNLDDFHFENWRYSRVALSWRELKPWLNQLGLALILVGEHEDYRSGNLDLLTAADGAFVQIDGDYRLREAGPGQSLGIRAWGVANSFMISQKKGAYTLQLQVKDLGFAYFSRGRGFSREGQLRFEGVEFAGLRSLNDSLWQAETAALEAEVYAENLEQYWALLPFQLNFRAHYRWREGSAWQQAFAQVDYLHLAAYRPRIELGLRYGWGQNWHLEAAGAYGGFNTWALPLRLAYHSAHAWQFSAQLSNALGLAFPGWSGASWASVGLGYKW